MFTLPIPHKGNTIASATNAIHIALEIFTNV